MKIMISTDGLIKFIYSDDLRGLLNMGDSEIKRASHVEPTGDGKWEADLSPVKGPKLGPFTTRKEALDAEFEWLERNHLGKSNE